MIYIKPSEARPENMMKLKKKLIQSEIDILEGRTHSVEETAAAMRKAIAEAVASKGI